MPPGELGAWAVERGHVQCTECAPVVLDAVPGHDADLAATLAWWTADAGVLLLEDRRAGRAKLDHLAVGPAGVFVIASRRHRGPIEVQRRRRVLLARTCLVVGGRDRTAVANGVQRQADAVSAALDDAGIAVRPILCFADGDWPRSAELQIGGVAVCAPRRAAKLCGAPGPLPPERVRAVAWRLAKRLPPA